MSQGYAKPAVIVSEVLAIGTVKFSAGTLSSNRSDITFANSHGVSFGLETNGFMTASVDITNSGLSNIKFSAGTLSSLRSDITFSNTNGVSFGLDSAGVLTATVATNYQSPGAYLTTAMGSNQGSNFVQATAGIAGTNVSGTIASGGISLSGPTPGVRFFAGALAQVLTQLTFSDSNGVSFGLSNGILTATVVTAGGGGGSVNFSAGTLSSNRSNITFADSNGVSFGLNTAGQITATVATNYQSTGAYLTTAGLSQDSSKYAGTAGAITGGSITVNTAGVSVNLPAYLTTAARSQDSSKYAGTTAGITGGSLTVNTLGVAISLPAYLTTAQSPGAYLTTAALSQDSSKYAGTNGAITGGSLTVNTSGVSINLPAYLTTADLSQNSSKYAGTTAGITGGSMTVNTAGVAISLPAYLTTAQSPGAYLTTAALSQDSSKYAGTAGAITGGSITVNTAGVSVNLPAYLTTAMASNRGTDFVQATAAFAGTNASGTIASGGISISVAAAAAADVKWSAGTLSSNRSDITFGNSNGVSFGLNTNGVLTATVATNYQSQGAYLTTAALSQDSSKYAGTSTGMAGGSVTLNTSGISISLPAYLTTAALSGDTTKYAGVGETVGTIAGTDLAMTVNTAGVSIGYPKWITTAQSPGAYLTTAALSQDSSKYAGTAGAITGGSITVNTSGVSINLPAYLTTAMASNRGSDFVQATAAFAGTNASGTIASGGISISVNPGGGGGAGTGFTSTSTAGANIVGTLSTNGLSMGVPAYLTTADLSQNSSKYAGTVGAITGGSITVNTAGVSINLPAYLTTAQPPGAYLTTAALSQDSSKYAGINAAITGGSITVNTSGVSINLPAYLTTAMASNRGSDFVQATAAFFGTNASGTIGSAGISISVAPGGTGGGGGAGTGFTTASTTGANIVGTLGAGGLSMGVPDPLVMSLSGNSGFVNSSQISNGGYALYGGDNVTLFQLDNTVMIHAKSWLETDNSSRLPEQIKFYEPHVLISSSSFSAVAGSWYLAPFVAPGPISGGRINLMHLNTLTSGIFRDVTANYASSITGTVQQSFTYSKLVGLWSQGTGTNSTRLESFWTGYFSWGWSKDIRVSVAGVSNVKMTIAHSLSYIQDINSFGGYDLSQYANSVTLSYGNSTTSSNVGDFYFVSARNMLSSAIVEPIGLNTLIPGGNYWLGFAWSTTRATAGTGNLASAMDFSYSGELGIQRQMTLEQIYRNWGATAALNSRSHWIPYGVYTGAPNMTAPQYIPIEGGLASVTNAWIPYFNFYYQGIT